MAEILIGFKGVIFLAAIVLLLAIFMPGIVNLIFLMAILVVVITVISKVMSAKRS